MVVAVAAVTALAGAGCGPGGPDKAAAGAPSAAARAVEQDRAAASRVQLTPADVPDLPPADPTPLNRLYARCGASSLLPGGDEPRAAAPAAFFKDETATVKRPQTTALAAYAALGVSEEAARVALSTLRSPEFRTCMERELRTAVNTGAGRQVVSTASTAELVSPIVGDDAVAFRITLSGSGGVYQTLDLTTVRRGRAVVSVATSRLGATAFPDEERVRLPRLMANRLGG
jgi:hypothetical protein